MDEALSLFLSVNSVILMITVVIAMFFVKRIVELKWPNLRPKANEMDHKPMYATRMALWWNQIILYALPVLLGVGLAHWILEAMPLPGSKMDLRLFVGGGLGWLSDFLYEIFVKAIQNKTGVQLPNPDASIPPVSPDK